MLLTGRLDPSKSSQLITVINAVINRPVNISGHFHGTLVNDRERSSVSLRLRPAVGGIFSSGKLLVPFGMEILFDGFTTQSMGLRIWRDRAQCQYQM